MDLSQRFIDFIFICVNMVPIRRFSMDTFKQRLRLEQNRSSLIALQIQRIFRLKTGKNIGYYGHKKIKGIKLSVLVDLQGLPLSIIVVPANMNDSTLYIPTLKNFNIKRPVGRPVNRPSKVTAVWNVSYS